MKLFTCGAKTGNGMPCKAIVEARGKRCHWHGGLSTGCRTPLGRLANGLRLKRVRINGIRRGKVGAGTARRVAAAKRLKAWADREPIRRRKRLKWLNRQRIKSGLPLLTDAELDALSTLPTD